jgi:diguanylate cyclase (GGDEF)-like protein
MEALLPTNEATRLAALRDYAILDTSAEQAYDDITKMAAYICDTPVALMSLVDEDRQWFKSKVGLTVNQTPRSQAFCAHAVLQPDEVMVINDASRDARFADNPLVLSDPAIRFYAGAPLVTASGTAIGTVCVIDKVPRELNAPKIEALKALARQVVAQLELRRSLVQLRLQIAEHKLRQTQVDAYQLRLEHMNQVLVQQSSTDPLTGLKNRRAFDRVMNEQSSRTERSHSPLALALIDVDHFKSFNDAFGHVAGDEALQHLAKILLAQARTYDDAARYGGEEFAVILPDTSQEGAMVVAERFRQAVHDAPWAHRAITVSIGVATTTTVQGSMTLIERADKALYQAKDNGRNCVVVLDDFS